MKKNQRTTTTDPQQIAIVVNKVSKDFVLPHQRTQSVKQAFTGLFRKNNGAEKQHALRGIDFKINKGDFVGIVGRNGSGKSTLLKILAGIYQPSKGSVQVDGKLVPFIELGVGFNPDLTGRENVYLNGALLGFAKKEVDAMYDDIVDFAELRRFMDQKLKNYSSGMQVRLAFSMAIRAEADILLIDEVLAVGDADFQRKCFHYFRELKKSNTTVVLVTHDMDAVREYCDYAILIEKSHMVAEGTANEIATQYIQMFNRDAQSAEAGDDAQAGQKQKRWGNKNATMSSVTLSQRNIVDDHATIKMSLKIKAHKDLEEPVYGFMIRNEAGDAIVGTNTRIKQTETKALKKGDEFTLEWDIPNIFPEGTFYIDPSIVEDDLTTVCDWWEDAASFTIRRIERSPYPIQPQINVRIEA